MGIVQHDKDGGDTNGTIEVIATFVYARSPRSGPTVYSISSRARLRRRTSRVRSYGCALTVTPCEEPSARFDSTGNA